MCFLDLLNTTILHFLKSEKKSWRNFEHFRDTHFLNKIMLTIFRFGKVKQGETVDI